MSKFQNDGSLGMNANDQIHLLRSILEGTTDYAIFAKDLDRKILIWNEGAKRLYGYTCSEVMNNGSDFLFDPNDIKSGKIDEIFDEVKRKGLWSGELNSITKSGYQFKILMNISLRRNLKRQIVGYTLIARDLTELQKVLQILSKIKESERLLFIKNTELIEKIHEADVANRLKNEFVANMSHELRTPLNGIIGFSEMIYKEKIGTVSEKQKAYLSNILLSSRILLSLINDLLDHAKIGAGKMEFYPEKVFIKNIIDESYPLFNDLIFQKQLDLTIAVDSSVGEVFIDPLRLKQVLNNYISNAIKFTPSGGRIHVNISLTGDQKLCLEVKDTGIGIQKKDLSRLFKEFQQVSTGISKQYSGTGLGLALTRQIVEAQGGKVSVKSKFGKGSSFYAIIPAFTDRAPELHCKEVSQVSTAKIPKILVIESETQERRILLSALSSAGYQTQCANTVGKILQSTEPLNVDAIIFDFFLSDINNWRIFKAINYENSKNPVSPILFLILAQEAGNFGFMIQDFLIKPIVPENLLLAFKRAGSGPHQNKTVLIVDDDKNIVKSTKQTLVKFGYKVFCKSNKKNALSAVDNQKIDIILVNLFMSGIEGFEFIRSHQRRAIKQNIPIIVWRSPSINEAELNHLKLRIQKIVLKDEDVSRSLLTEIEEYFPLSKRSH